MEANWDPYLNPNPSHVALIACTAEELLAFGGANSGKSFSIADKLLLRIATERAPLKFVVARRTLPSVKATAMSILEERAKLFGLPWNMNRQDMIAYCAGSQFLFRSANNREDIEKIRSLTDVDGMWLNELTEFREEDYDECLRRMRGGHGQYAQMIGDFNPSSTVSWVHERFFVKDIGHATKMHFTVMDNHPAYLATDKAKRYIARLDTLREHNPNAYRIFRLGEWGELEGRIFEWDVVPLPTDVKWDEIFYGGDFGYSVDPAAVVKIFRKGDEYWCQEMVYETELTNQMLGKRCLRLGVGANDQTYWDSAEPKSIAELIQLGIVAIPAIKGPDSVRSGIDTLKQLTIHIVEGSENIIREANSFVWKVDKDGHPLNVPVEFADHAMSAIRYGIVTSRSQSGMPLYTSNMLVEAMSKEREVMDVVEARLVAMEQIGVSERDWRAFAREAVRTLAARWREDGQENRARFADNEVNRLDRIHLV